MARKNKNIKGGVRLKEGGYHKSISIDIMTTSIDKWWKSTKQKSTLNPYIRAQNSIRFNCEEKKNKRKQNRHARKIKRPKE